MKFSRRVAIVLNSFIDFAPPRGPPPAPPDASGLFVHVVASQPECTYLYIRDTCAFSFSDKHLPSPLLASSHTSYIPPSISPSLAPRSFPPFSSPPSKLSPLDPLPCLHTCDKEREAQVLEGRRERGGQGEEGRGGEVSRQRLLRWKKRVHHFAK